MAVGRACLSLASEASGFLSSSILWESLGVRGGGGGGGGIQYPTHLVFQEQGHEQCSRLRGSYSTVGWLCGLTMNHDEPGQTTIYNWGCGWNQPNK